MIASLTTTLQRYSPKFWVLVGASFIDALGRTMAFPFFTLYITYKFDVGMTEAGILLGLFSISGFVGGMIGGALTDRFGRRGIVIFGLIFSSISSIAFGLVNEYAVFYVLAVFVGLLSDVAEPAYQAMVADILPEEQRAEGFGILRVVHNLAWVIGPMIGGFLISFSYLNIFIADAIASLIVAGIFFKMMPETKPERQPGEAPEPLLDSFVGYFKVAKDGLFLAFIVALIFSGIAYQQIYSTLPVFLRDIHGIPEKGYAYLTSANALLVVLTQFWISSKVSKQKPMWMLALGAFFYMIGLVMYGLFASFSFFLVAMLIISVGEMIVLPLAQALIAKFAPVEMRGRYMAFAGLSWLLPSTLGPGMAGLVMDNYNPDWVWYLCGVFCLISIGMFLFLNKRVDKRVGVQVPETS